MKYLQYIIGFFFIISCSIGIGATTLVDVYKQGEIVLEADPDFGKNIDWIEVFYDKINDLAVAPDGKIYVTNGQRNNIFIFNREGQLIKSFGQLGQGPLDFYAPGRPSVLDNKYLVVMDFPETRKITLVDMENIDTKHVKILKTRYVPWNVIALRDNKIAYMTGRFEQISKWDWKRVIDVIIKDGVTGDEKVVASYVYNYRCRSIMIQLKIYSFTKYIWTVYMARTKYGNLLTGSSDQPNFDIFDPDGKKIKSLFLDYQPIKYTSGLKDEIMDMWTNSARGRTPEAKRIAADFKNAMSGSSLLGDHLPYYTYLTVDSSGNILVLMNSLCYKDCETRFRVYSPEGRFICETKINPGKFDFGYGFRFYDSPKIRFTEDGIFGLWEIKDTEDISTRLVRVKLKVKK